MTNSIRLDEETYKLRQLVSEMRRKKEDEDFIRFHLQEQRYTDEAIEHELGRGKEGYTQRLSPLAEQVKNNPEKLKSYTPTKRTELEMELAEAGVDISQVKPETIGGVASGSELIGDSNVMKLGQSKAAMDFLSDLEKVIDDKQYSNVFAPIRGYIGKKNPYHTETQAVQSQIDATKQLVGKYLEEGVLRKEDEIKYEKILPKVGDTQKVAKKKVENVRRMIENKVKAEMSTLGAAGYDVDEIMQAVQQTEQQGVGTDAEPEVPLETPTEEVDPNRTVANIKGQNMNQAEVEQWIGENPNDPIAQLLKNKLPEKKTELEVEQEIEPKTETSEESLFGDAWGDLTGIAEGIGESVDKRVDKTQQIRGSDTTIDQKAFRIFGQGVGFIGDIVGEAVIGGGKLLLTPEQEDKVKETMMTGASKVFETRTVKGMMEQWEKLKETNPEAAENVEAVMNILDGVTSFAVVNAPVKQAFKMTTKQGLKAGSKALSGASKTGSAVKGAGAFGVNQFTGLSDDTRKTIIKHFDKFTPEEMATFNEEAVFNKIGDSIDGRLKDMDDSGKMYDEIRAGGEFTNIDPTFLDNVIKGLGFDVNDGIITKTSKSKSRADADVNALQSFYDDWVGKETIDADEFLNMRRDLDKLAKWQMQPGRTSDSAIMARGIRNKLNSKYRKDITGLEDLDGTLSKQKQELEKLKGTIFMADGRTLKPNALSNIAALEKGKKYKGADLLKRVEELSPGITEDVNILRAIKDIEHAGSGFKVGTYMRPILGGTAGMQVAGPAGALLGMIVTSPKLTVPILRAYGKLKATKSGIIEGIISKMKNGTELVAKEKKIVGAALDDSARKLAKRVDEGLDNVSAGMAVSSKSIDKVARKLDTDDIRVISKFMGDVEFAKGGDKLARSLGGEMVDMPPTIKVILKDAGMTDKQMVALTNEEAAEFLHGIVKRKDQLDFNQAGTAKSASLTDDIAKAKAEGKSFNEFVEERVPQFKEKREALIEKANKEHFFEYNIKIEAENKEIFKNLKNNLNKLTSTKGLVLSDNVKLIVKKNVLYGDYDAFLKIKGGKRTITKPLFGNVYDSGKTMKELKSNISRYLKENPFSSENILDKRAFSSFDQKYNVDRIPLSIRKKALKMLTEHKVSLSDDLSLKTAESKSIANDIAKLWDINKHGTTKGFLQSDSLNIEAYALKESMLEEIISKIKKTKVQDITIGKREGIVYFDVGNKQVSFHTRENHNLPLYTKEWVGKQEVNPLTSTKSQLKKIWNNAK